MVMLRPAGLARFRHGSSVSVPVAGGLDAGFTCEKMEDLAPDPDPPAWVEGLTPIDV